MSTVKLNLVKFDFEIWHQHTNPAFSINMQGHTVCWLAPS